ncbi:MAG: Na+:solute symporter [Acidobacteria bacterium]|nr:Na+:solute symporter [Acidobacteriota bacterium]
MVLSTVDWIILAAYFALTFGVAWMLRGRAQRSLTDFFVSGRGVPWWIAGTSMVATTFAADTPLTVTGLTAQFGIAGNWLWWSLLLSGMLTVFFFARLWRRAGVLTDVELIELRYAGRPAAFLRGFRALYLGLLVNGLIMGWVNLGMVKVFTITLHLDKKEAVFACLLIIALYTTLSGLWGVLITDLLQFILMIAMAITLAWFAVSAAGGLGALRTKLLALDEAQTGSGSLLAFFPELHSAWMPLTAFLVFVGVIWWASWYPGAEPGGGGYVAQRIFCAKDEKHSLWATLWFNIAHYALRPWPWILVGLASVVLYPNLKDKEAGYVQVMVDHLPASLRGLMLASFLAAYMSTLSTHLNWGASYMVNDFYRRFLRPHASEPHLLRTAQVATLLLMLLGAGVTYLLETIRGGWELLLLVSAGTGAVYILRWYWWRISAWSEISAMTAAFLGAMALTWQKPFTGGEQIVFAKNMLLNTVLCTVVWLAVTYLTRPEPLAHLESFYRRVRPAAWGWRAVAATAPDVPAVSSGWYNLRAWALGCALVYLVLFSTGKLLLGFWSSGLLLAAGAVAAAVLLYLDFARRGWESFG